MHLSTLDAEALLEMNRLRIAARVVANVAHDLNNVLQVIGGSAEMLAMRSSIGPVEQRRIETIGHQTGRAAAMLARLAAYTRGDRTERQTADLGELVDTAVALRDFSLHRARIEVAVELGRGAPYRARVVRPLILQVFLNVLLNAEEALKDRSGGTIHIRVDRLGGDCEVAFTDNGPGLAEPEAVRLRLDSSAPPSVGPALSGIGLWVSKHIAAQHGGRIEIASVPNAGTTVVVAVPAA